MLRACILLLSLLSVLLLGLAHSRSSCTLVGSEPLGALIGNLWFKGGAGSRSFHFQVPRRGRFVVRGSHLEDPWILEEKWERVCLFLFTLWFCLLAFEKGSLRWCCQLDRIQNLLGGIISIKISL